MRVLRIDHVQLAMPPGEEERAREFYAGCLGMTEVPKPPELAGRGGVWFVRGTANVHLGVDRRFRPAKKAHPAFVVEDLGSAIDSLRENGCAASAPEIVQGRRRMFVEDPFGNRIELVDGAEVFRPQPDGASS